MMRSHETKISLTEIKKEELISLGDTIHWGYGTFSDQPSDRGVPGDYLCAIASYRQ
jgi:hypothetical protein